MDGSHDRAWRRADVILDDRHRVLSGICLFYIPDGDYKMSDADEFVIQRMLNPELPIRSDVKQALINYATKGYPLGDFLTAVLENNLFEALGRADMYNRQSIHQICYFVYNELPSGCWGSREAMLNHYAKFRSKQEMAEIIND